MKYRKSYQETSMITCTGVVMCRTMHGCGVVGYVQTIVQCCCGDHFCIIIEYLGTHYAHYTVGDGQLLTVVQCLSTMCNRQT